MYHGLLFVHSWLRWLVVIFGLLTLVSAFSASSRSDARGGAAGRFGLFFMICLDTELLIGAILYFFSTPWLSMMLTDAGMTMGNRVARFWAVEHIFGMVVAVALAHVGRIAMKKATSSEAGVKKLATFTFIALVFILGTIPWPMMAYGRPLIRW